MRVAHNSKLKNQKSTLSTLWFSSHCVFLFRQFIASDDAMVFQVNAVKGESQGFQGLFSYRRFQLAFPDRYAMPTHFCKLALFLQVTVTIALYLCFPEIHICLWKHIILTAFMPMPETTVDKDYRAILAQHYIRMTRKTRMVKPIAKASAEKIFPNQYFRFGTLPSY